MKPIAQLVILICFLLSGSQIALANWQPFSLVNGNIIIDVEIEGQSVKAVLDSGATHHIISNELVENYGREFKESKTIREVGIYGEREIQSLGRIKALFHKTDKYRSRLMCQLSPQAPTFGHAIQLDCREISQKWNYWCRIQARSTVCWLFTAPRGSQGDRSVPRPVENSLFNEISVSLRQANNPVAGGALVSGNMPVPV